MKVPSDRGTLFLQSYIKTALTTCHQIPEGEQWLHLKDKFTIKTLNTFNMHLLVMCSVLHSVCIQEFRLFLLSVAK